jgi:lysophospholipase L1-like esterase
MNNKKHIPKLIWATLCLIVPTIVSQAIAIDAKLTAKVRIVLAGDSTVTIKAVSPNDPKTGKVDGTHLNVKGGEAVGKLVAEELKKVEPVLANYLKP